MKRLAIAAAVVIAGGAGMAAILIRPQDERVVTAQNAPETTLVRLDTGKAPRLVTEPDKTAAIPAKTEAAPDLSGESSLTVPQISPVASKPSPTFLDGIAALERRDSLDAIAARDRIEPGSIERETLTWAIAVSGQSNVPASELIAARQLPSYFPARDAIEASLEEAMLRESVSHEAALAALDPTTLETPDGAILLMRAYLSRSDKASALGVLHRFWHGERMGVADEDAILKEFGDLITPTDQRLRLKFLLFSDRFAQAERFAALGEAKSLYDAFLAVARRNKDAKKKLAAAQSAWRDDPVYTYLQIRRLRQQSAYKDAAPLFARMPANQADLVDPGAWWNEARIVSRGLMEQGRAKDAYALASSHVASRDSDVADAEFHAGWYALRGLNSVEKAEPHFRKILASSSRAHDRARAYYWLGRVEKKRGRQAEAQQQYRAAAEFGATFYGQLAGRHVQARDKSRMAPDVTLRDSTAFAARPEIQALTLLDKAGVEGRARRLYLALARHYDDPFSLQLLAEKALHLYGPNLALAIGKAALAQGHDPGLAAFPLGAIPDEADISGAGRALAYAIARQESAFRPDAISPADARGLLQILPSTAKRVAKRYELAYAEERLTTDPAYNATLGSHYLSEQLARFDGSYVLTFAAYNAGPGRIPGWIKRYGDPRRMAIDGVVDWIENIPFPETRDYVQKVMENYQVYKGLLNQPTDIVADLTAGRR